MMTGNPDEGKKYLAVLCKYPINEVCGSLHWSAGRFPTCFTAERAVNFCCGSDGALTALKDGCDIWVEFPVTPVTQTLQT